MMYTVVYSLQLSVLGTIVTNKAMKSGQEFTSIQLKRGET